jgi:hypothetical protein
VSWARRLGKAAVVVAYVATDPIGAARATLRVLEDFRRDAG